MKKHNDTFHIPPELHNLLENNPPSLEIFESLPPSHKKEYLNWVLSSKKEETRKKNMKKMIQMLLNNKK
jgi:uncharacterized protein YdeI (YjbR/CyaY-like superfamily)